MSAFPTRLEAAWRQGLCFILAFNSQELKKKKICLILAINQIFAKLNYLTQIHSVLGTLHSTLYILTKWTISFPNEVALSFPFYR